MSEYIERQAVLDEIDEDIEEFVECDYALKFTKRHIKKIPSADVRPVVRGRWEVVDWVECDGHGECVHYPKEGLRCTNCKNVFKKKLLWKDNYCPNCGADMREGKP